MTNSKILLAVFILLANFAFSQNNLFNFLSENDKTLTKLEKAKIDRLKKNLVFKEFHVSNVGNVKALENRDKLPINLPNVKGVLFAERTHLDALNENEFIWEGVFPNDEGSIFINSTKDGVFGRIKYQEITYSIESIGKGKVLILLHDNEVFTPNECGTDASSGHIDHEINLETRTHCSHLPIRVGVLFTQAAQNTGLNMNNIATTAINDLNAILTNSNIANHDARFLLSGVQLLAGFNETANIVTDGNNLANNAAAQNFRNQSLSDVVVLLTNGPYGAVLGRANQIAATNGNAYAIVQANVANANFTFGHEVTHLIGGRHQQCAIDPFNCDDAPGFAHGFFYRTGVWPFRSEKITLMHTLSGAGTRQRELSFPTQKGTAAGNDNARMMRDNACAVSQFRLNPLSINISGPGCLPSTSTGTWCVNISNCPSVQSISWQRSYDGWNYTSIGSTSCISTTHFEPNTYLRVTVNCTGGQTATANFTVSTCYYRIVNNEEVKVEKTPEIEVYPNPASSDFTLVIRNVSSEPKDVYISNTFGARTKINYNYDPSSKSIFAQYNAELLSKGLHLVTYFENNTIVSKKLMIQHE